MNSGVRSSTIVGAPRASEATYIQQPTQSQPLLKSQQASLSCGVEAICRGDTYVNMVGERCLR